MPDALSLALEMLTRREHSAHDLVVKLARKGCEESSIAEALAECQRLGYQSDHRYVDSYTRMRIGQGDGPFKIGHFLRSKGVAEEIIQNRLDEEYWLDIACKVWEKKFGVSEKTLSLSEKAKQHRFMLNRGFPPAVIYELFERCVG